MFGTQSATQPWRIVLSAPREPRCPGCCEFLQPAAVIFRNEWAWCPVCVNLGLPDKPHLILALGSAELGPLRCVDRGLRFYVPHDDLGPPKNAWAFYEAQLLTPVLPAANHAVLPEAWFTGYGANKRW